jgi:hypothetical protein
MLHGRTQFGQQVASGVDLAIDFATLGEYGLEPRPEPTGWGWRADGSCRERTDRRSRPNRRPGWEASATTRRGACATNVSSDAIQWRFPGPAPSRVNFRAALERYAA